MPKYSIIIPACGQHKMTEDCIESIYKHSRDFEIIVITNGGGAWYRSDVKVISNEVNLGFPIAVNQGIKASTGDVIVVLNNDTIVTPYWLDHLSKHLEIYDVVGPVTNNISGPQKIECQVINNSEAIDLFAQKLHFENNCQIYPFHRLVFFCVVIKKEVINKIGLLDEQFSPGNFEDDDYCMMAIEAGFRLGIAEDVFIYHIGSQSFKNDPVAYNELLRVNKAKFEAKWPSDKQYLMQLKCQKNE